jgi:hypothetical protein
VEYEGYLKEKERKEKKEKEKTPSLQSILCPDKLI